MSTGQSSSPGVNCTHTNSSLENRKKGSTREADRPREAHQGDSPSKAGHLA